MLMQVMAESTQLRQWRLGNSNLFPLEPSVHSDQEVRQATQARAACAPGLPGTHGAAPPRSDSSLLVEEGGAHGTEQSPFWVSHEVCAGCERRVA